MKRSGISVREVADWHNLSVAFHLAQRGKHKRAEVKAFRAALNDNLALLREDLLRETYVPGPFFTRNLPRTRYAQIHG